MCGKIVLLSCALVFCCYLLVLLVLLLSVRIGSIMHNVLPINSVWLMRWVAAKIRNLRDSVFYMSFDLSCLWLQSLLPRLTLYSAQTPRQNLSFAFTICMFFLQSFCLRIPWFDVGFHSVSMRLAFAQNFIELQTIAQFLCEFWLPLFLAHLVW